MNNIVEYTNEEIEIVCVIVFQILISQNGLLDLNEVIDVEDECKHGDATRLPTVLTSNLYNLS